MAELLLLDPEAVAEDRVEVNITELVAEAGPDFGDAAIEAFKAQAARGEIPVDSRLPNRQITVPLILTDRTLSFDEARRVVQAKVALFQAEGGWIGRETQVGNVYADVTAATLKMGAGYYAAHGLVDPDAVLTLECLPDWYGDEITLDEIVKNAGATFPEVADILRLNGSPAIIQGDYPGRCRIVVEEQGSSDQRSVFGGFRSRHYDPAVTARLSYEAEALTPLDAAVIVPSANSAWNDSVKHSSLATTWTSVLSTEIAGVGDMTHVGSYRVRARVRTDAYQLRLLYDVGDMRHPSENAPWTTPAAAAGRFCIADLGSIRIDRAPVGTHRWRGHIQAIGTSGGEDCEIDRVWLQPVDECAWEITTPLLADVGLTTIAVRDDFTRSDEFDGVDLNGQDLPVGTGTWTEAGDPDGFTINATVDAAQRTAVSDTASLTVFVASTRSLLRRFSTLDFVYAEGCFELAGSDTFRDIAVQIDVKASASVDCQQGVVLRYTDTSNYLLAIISLEQKTIAVIKCVAGTPSIIGIAALPFVATTGAFYTVRAQADSDGWWAAWAAPQGGRMNAALVAGFDPELATAGTGVLDTGRVGIFDGQTSSTANTRTYDNFSTWVPYGDAVLFADGVAELRTDGCWREIESGYGYGKLNPLGDLPRVSPSGLEQRPVELLLKLSRGDLGDLPDIAFDSLTVQAFYRPSWLHLPEV